MILKSLFSIFRKDKPSRVTSVLNIVSFSISIAVFILIALYIQFELNFDKHLPNARNMYRFTTDMFWESGAVQHTAVSPVASGSHLVKDFPEITKATTFASEFGLLFSIDEETIDQSSFYEDNVFFVDTCFDDFFDISMLQGDFNQIISKPNQLILSSSKAQQYFGAENAIGKTIKVRDLGSFVIGGVMKNMPDNSHLHSEILISNRTLPNFKNPVWRDLNAYTYVLKDSNARIEQIDAKFDAFIEKYMKVYVGLIDFRLQAVLDIHLKNDRLFDISRTFSIKNIYFLIAIGIFILIIAVINFINLSSVIYRKRSKEIGMRKVLGAKTKAILLQFIQESGFLTLLSICISIMVIGAIFPVFKSIVDYQYLHNYFDDIVWFYLLILGVGTVLGGISVLNINRYSSISLLNSGSANKISKKTFKLKALVTFQFSLSIVLLICIIVNTKQMSFIKNKELGFNQAHVMSIEVNNDSTYQVSERLQAEFIKIPSIQAAGLSNYIPGEKPFSEHFIIEGFEKFRPLNTINVDREYMNLMQFEILSGRNFSHNKVENTTSCIINETALQKFGWSLQEAIGKKISWNFANNRDDKIDGEVIGVVKDFHYNNLHMPIEELVITSHKNEYPLVSLKLSDGNVNQTIEKLKLTHQVSNPETPFKYEFLEQRLINLYAEDKKISTVLSIFNILAILISCIGLYSLTTMNISNKIKEIGIRKVNGAKTHEIVFLLNQEIVKWILLAFIIATPVAYFSMKKWLLNFAYKTELSWWIFALAGIIAMGIALLTVSWQSWKAARRNPVESLRYE